MKHPLLQNLQRAAALAAAVVLQACGGGGGGASNDPPVVPVLQTINFASPGNQAFSSTTVALQATASSGLVVALTSTTPAVCTVSNAVLTLVGVGSCSLTANQAGSANFLPAAAVSQSFTVTVAAQSLTFVSPGNQSFGIAPAPLTASASSGLAVTFASTTPAVCTVSGNTLALVGVGTCTVSASQPGNANYNAAPPVAQTFTVAMQMAPQTINFTAPADQRMGVAPAALVATASSGLPVSLVSTTPAICSVSGRALSLVTFGSCTLAASQAGDLIYAAAPAVLRTFNVLAATQTITFGSPGNQTLGTAPAALLATSTSGLPVALVSTTPAVCTVVGTTLNLQAAGTCTVAADQAGNSTFAAAATVLQSFVVAAAPQSITFTSPGNQTMGTAPPALAATATSGLVVSLVSSTPTVCTVGGTSLTLVAAGVCTVTASQAGNSSFAAATAVSRSFTVNGASQLITFNSPGNQTLGTAPPPLVASAASGLGVSFTSATPAVCTVSGTSLTLVTVGTCTLDANQAGNSSTAAAPTVTQSFSVGAAPLVAQTISFASPGDQTFGTAAPTLVATASSGLPVSLVSSTAAVCTISGARLLLAAAGTCTLTASQAGNSSFSAAVSVTHSLTVNPAAQSISFSAVGNQTLGTAPAALVASATSGLPVSLASSTPAVCTVSGTTLTLVAAGSCTLTASQAGNGSYAGATPMVQTFTVVAAAQTITFTSPGSQVLGVAPPALVASASSGLAVTLTSSTTGVCTVSGTTLTLVAAGSCTISASQAGAGIYAAAPTVPVSFMVIAPIELFANGGFETVGLTTPAHAWLSGAAGYTRVCTGARTGTCAAQLRSPQFNAAIMLQNSVDQGAMPPLVVGTRPVLSFWAKGTAGATGNVLFALRYLDGIGNILYNSQNQFFQGQINTTSYTRITFNGGVVPPGATAAFIEFSQGIGPIGTGPAGEDWFEGRVLIDDLSLSYVP